MTGSGTFSNTGSSGRNAYVENKDYFDCYITSDYFDGNSDPSTDSDSTPGWIWALISLSAIINLALFIFICIKKIKKRNEEAQRPKNEKVSEQMLQGQPPRTSLNTKPDNGFFDVGMAPDKGEADNEGQPPSYA